MSEPPPTYEAVVIGGGICGMYVPHRLREVGVRFRVFEAAADVGGTWYWCRYPGARFDSESWSDGYFFDEDILQEWEWKEYFFAQLDTLEYLAFAAISPSTRK